MLVDPKAPSFKFGVIVPTAFRTSHLFRALSTPWLSCAHSFTPPRVHPCAGARGSGRGQFVRSVDFDGPAHVWGLRAGDRLLAVNGIVCEDQDHETVIQYIRNTPPTKNLELVVSALLNGEHDIIPMVPAPHVASLSLSPCVCVCVSVSAPPPPLSPPPLAIQYLLSVCHRRRGGLQIHKPESVKRAALVGLSMGTNSLLFFLASKKAKLTVAGDDETGGLRSRHEGHCPNSNVWVAQNQGRRSHLHKDRHPSLHCRGNICPHRQTTLHLTVCSLPTLCRVARPWSTQLSHAVVFSGFFEGVAPHCTGFFCK